MVALSIDIESILYGRIKYVLQKTGTSHPHWCRAWQHSWFYHYTTLLLYYYSLTLLLLWGPRPHWGWGWHTRSAWQHSWFYHYYSLALTEHTHTRSTPTYTFRMTTQFILPLHCSLTLLLLTYSAPTLFTSSSVMPRMTTQLILSLLLSSSTTLWLYYYSLTLLLLSLPHPHWCRAWRHSWFWKSAARCRPPPAPARLH